MAKPSVFSRSALASPVLSRVLTAASLSLATLASPLWTEQTSAGDRRVWTQVKIFNGKTGWISRTGVNGLGSNVTRLPDSQCGS